MYWEKKKHFKILTRKFFSCFVERFLHLMSKWLLLARSRSLVFNNPNKSLDFSFCSLLCAPAFSVLSCVTAAGVVDDVGFCCDCTCVEDLFLSLAFLSFSLALAALIFANSLSFFSHAAFLVVVARLVVVVVLDRVLLGTAVLVVLVVSALVEVWAVLNSIKILCLKILPGPSSENVIGVSVSSASVKFGRCRRVGTDRPICWCPACRSSSFKGTRFPAKYEYNFWENPSIYFSLD